MKKICLFITVMLISFLMHGHEFWIQPNKYIYNAGETVNIRFFTGPNFKGSNWEGNRSKIQGLFFYWANLKDNCNQHLSANTGDSLKISVIDEGTAMLTFQSTPIYREMEAAEFEQYLFDNRLTEQKEERIINNKSGSTGKENYHHIAKTIFQVGTKTDKTFSRKTGLPIDIIPEQNPYALTKDGDFKIKILNQGKPLQNAPVKIWHRLNEKISVHSLETDDQGEVTFFISTLGEWMVSAMVMESLKGNEKAEWKTFHGTLTWGYLK